MTRQLGSHSSEWIWCGGAHHFAGRRKCTFHLATQIGDVLVSTIGQYTVDGEWEPLGFWAGREHFYETFIARVEGPGEGCGIAGWSAHSGEVVELYETAADANEGHMQLCREVAAGITGPACEETNDG